MNFNDIYLMFLLDNDQRKYIGLDPIKSSWDKIVLKGDAYRSESLLYFEDNIIKRQVVSNELEYREYQYNEPTQDREWLLPKTSKGKAKKLTGSVLERRNPIGVYLNVRKDGVFVIGSHTNQKTFYSRDWEFQEAGSSVSEMIAEFIDNSPESHLKEIEVFRNSKRENVKYKSGDFFAFKLNRKEFGFGRVLLDVHKARKKGLIPEGHGLSLLMFTPVLIKMYAYKSENKKVDLEHLKKQKALPSDYIMDNALFYGDYEILGNIPLERDEIDFPISYGNKLALTSPNVFLQWGLIHKEVPKKVFNKYTSGINLKMEEPNPSSYVRNPYGYYGIGIRPCYSTFDILNTIDNNGEFNYENHEYFKADWDLRNPKNKSILHEILTSFGLDPKGTYETNSKNAGVKDILDFIAEM